MTAATAEAPAVKAGRLTAAGYRQAGAESTCGLCARPVNAGQWVRAMPAGWHPGTAGRDVHYRCHAALLEQVRAKAAGQPVPPLPWEKPGKPLNSKQRKLAAARLAAAPYVRADGQRAAAHVASVVARTGAGPTWRELAQAMGWPMAPRATFGAIMTGLARAGWLRFTEQERSLRLGPEAGR